MDEPWLGGRYIHDRVTTGKADTTNEMLSLQAQFMVYAGNSKGAKFVDRVG